MHNHVLVAMMEHDETQWQKKVKRAFGHALGAPGGLLNGRTLKLTSFTYNYGIRYRQISF
jgi:hypothetical protein